MMARQNQVRISRRNSFGVPERRMLGVTMEVARRNQVPTFESVVLAARRKDKQRTVERAMAQGKHICDGSTIQ